MAKDSKTTDKPADTATKAPPVGGAVPTSAGAAASPPVEDKPKADDKPKSDDEPPEGGSNYDGINVLRKLSPKSVMGKIKRPKLADPGDPTANPPVPPTPADPPKSLYVVMGQTNGIKTGESDNGVWTAFLGAFEAVRSDNGERYQSSMCFVPKSFEDLLLQAVERAQDGDASAMVEFAIEVGLIPSEASVTGYEYTVKNLVKIQSGDPLAALRANLMQMKALPAPKPAPKPAAA